MNNSTNSNQRRIFSNFSLDTFAFTYIKYWTLVVILLSIVFFSYYILYYEYYRPSCYDGPINIYKSSINPLPLYNFE